MLYLLCFLYLIKEIFFDASGFMAETQINRFDKKIIYEQFANEGFSVRAVLLRSTGMVDHAEIHIDLIGDEQQLSDIEMLSLRIQMAISSAFPSIERYPLFIIRLLVLIMTLQSQADFVT